MEDGHLLIYSGVLQKTRAEAGVACLKHEKYINQIQI